jgi:hypothetical protein
VFELGVDLFDRIEVGAVGWQEQQPRASGPDGGPDSGLLVAGEVVADDDVAWPLGGARGAPLPFSTSSRIEQAFLRASARPKYSLKGPIVMFFHVPPTRLRRMNVLMPD